MHKEYNEEKETPVMATNSKPLVINAAPSKSHFVIMFVLLSYQGSTQCCVNSL
jgi:hypothetical protein